LEGENLGLGDGDEVTATGTVLTAEAFFFFLIDTLSVLDFILFDTLRPCLVPRKFCKIFHIPRHIESLDAYMEY